MAKELPDYIYSKDSKIKFLTEISGKSTITYKLALAFIITCLVSSNYIYVDVSQSALFVIESSSHQENIFTYYSGRIEEIYVNEYQKIKKGDLILKLDASLAVQKKALVSLKIKRLLQQQYDLKLLSARNFKKIDTTRLLSNSLRARYYALNEKINNAQTNLDKFARAYNRYEKLYSKNVISIDEFEQHKFEYGNAISNLMELYQDNISTYKREEYENAEKISSLQEELATLDKQIQTSRIYANVDGYLYFKSAVKKGVNVKENNVIAEIYPNNALVVQCYVSSADIGLIRKGQRVNLSYNSFKYTDWGISESRIIRILEDPVVMDGKSYFKVICEFNENSLKLANGYRARIVKGMNGVANFILVRRSLRQLVTDKAADWFDPKRIVDGN